MALRRPRSGAQPRLRRTFTSAPGKAVLLGEYAVLEGAPALVTAIDRRARVELVDAACFALEAPALGLQAARFDLMPDGRLTFENPQTDADAKLKTVRAVFQTLHQAARAVTALRPCRISIDTAAFSSQDGTKLGLGSSAAVSVALMHGLVAHNDALDAVLSSDPARQKQSLATLAQAAHAHAQGDMGSGVDIAASVHGGVLRFSRVDGTIRVKACAPLPALRTAFTWAGHATSTPEFLQRVRAFKAEDAPGHRALMQQLCVASQAGVDAWSRGHVPDFLAAVATSFAHLATLGEKSGADIASLAHRTMGQVVANAGGVYKTSGAGGGDLGVAFAATGPVADDMARALAAADFSVLPLAFDPVGVQIEACTSSHGKSP